MKYETDTYARDRIRFLERLIFDLLEQLILESEDPGDYMVLQARLCAERGSV